AATSSAALAATAAGAAHQRNEQSVAVNSVRSAEAQSAIGTCWWNARYAADTDGLTTGQSASGTVAKTRRHFRAETGFAAIESTRTTQTSCVQGARVAIHIDGAKIG